MPELSTQEWNETLKTLGEPRPPDAQAFPPALSFPGPRPCSGGLGLSEAEAG